jgi:hypothetical protein
MYRLNHICPLELGCSPLDRENFQLQPLRDSILKDNDENHAHAGYCRGTISRPEAVHFVTDGWWLYAPGTDTRITAPRVSWYFSI